MHVIFEDRKWKKLIKKGFLSPQIPNIHIAQPKKKEGGGTNLNPSESYQQLIMKKNILITPESSETVRNFFYLKKTQSMVH